MPGVKPHKCHLHRGDFITLSIYDEKDNKRRFLAYNPGWATYSKQASELSSESMKKTDIEQGNYSENMGGPQKNQSHFSLLTMEKGQYPPHFQNRCVFQVVNQSSNQDQFSFGDTVRYGSSIQLALANLDKYIGIFSSYSKHVLSTNISAEQGTQFTVLPRFKIRSEGEVVKIGDQVVLHSRAFFSKYVGVDVTDGQYPLVACKFVQGWHVDRFKECENDSLSIIHAGSFLRLFHREEEAYVAAYNDFENSWENNNPLLDIIKKLIIPKHFNTKVVMKQSKALQKSKETNSGCSVWQIETDHPADGRPIEWNSPCRFRHLYTGKYLCLVRKYTGVCSPSKGKRNKHKFSDDIGSRKRTASYLKPKVEDLIISTTSSYTDPSTAFIFTGLDTNENEHPFVSFKSYTRVKHVETGIYLVSNAHLDSQRDSEILQARQSSNLGIDVDVSIVLDEEKSDKIDLEDTTKLDFCSYLKRKEIHISLSNLLPEKDVFLIVPVSKKNVIDAHHASTLRPDLLKVIDMLYPLCYEDGILETKKVKALLKRFPVKLLVMTCQELISFISGKNERISHGANTYENEKLFAIPSRQKLLLECNFVELLIALVDSLFVVHTKYSVPFCEDINHLCKSIYQLLRLIIADYPKSCNLLKHLNGMKIMFSHLNLSWNPPIEEVFVVSNPKASHLQRPSGMFEAEIKLLVNNLQQYIESNEVPPAKLLDFLASACMPGGKCDSKTQLLILEILFGYQPAASCFLYIMRLNRFTNVMEISTSQNLLQPKGYIKSDKAKNDPYKPNARLWKKVEDWLLGADPSSSSYDPKGKNVCEVLYFRSLIRLCSSLCKGQNVKSQEVIRQFISVDIILHFLMANGIPTLDRVNMCSLLRVLFIENDCIPTIKSTFSMSYIWEEYGFNQPTNDKCKIFSRNSQVCYDNINNYSDLEATIDIQNFDLEAKVIDNFYLLPLEDKLHMLKQLHMQKNEVLINPVYQRSQLAKFLFGFLSNQLASLNKYNLDATKGINFARRRSGSNAYINGCCFFYNPNNFDRGNTNRLKMANSVLKLLNELVKRNFFSIIYPEVEEIAKSFSQCIVGKNVIYSLREVFMKHILKEQDKDICNSELKSQDQQSFEILENILLNILKASEPHLFVESKKLRDFKNDPLSLHRYYDKMYFHGTLSESHQILLETKHIICTVLELCCDIRQLNRLNYTWKCFQETYIEAIESFFVASSNEIFDYSNLEAALSENALSLFRKSCKVPINDCISYIMNFKSKNEIIQAGKTLLNLSLFYDNSLAADAYHLIYRIFDNETEFFSILSNSNASSCSINKSNQHVTLVFNSREVEIYSMVIFLKSQLDSIIEEAHMGIINLPDHVTEIIAILKPSQKAHFRSNCHKEWKKRFDVPHLGLISILIKNQNCVDPAVNSIYCFENISYAFNLLNFLNRHIDIGEVDRSVQNLMFDSKIYLVILQLLEQNTPAMIERKQSNTKSLLLNGVHESEKILPKQNSRFLCCSKGRLQMIMLCLDFLIAFCVDNDSNISLLVETTGLVDVLISFISIDKKVFRLLTMCCKLAPSTIFKFQKDTIEYIIRQIGQICLAEDATADEEVAKDDDETFDLGGNQSVFRKIETVKQINIYAISDNSVFYLFDFLKGILVTLQKQEMRKEYEHYQELIFNAVLLHLKESKIDEYAFLDATGEYSSNIVDSLYEEITKIPGCVKDEIINQRRVLGFHLKFLELITLCIDNGNYTNIGNFSKIFSVNSIILRLDRPNLSIELKSPFIHFLRILCKSIFTGSPRTHAGIGTVSTAACLNQQYVAEICRVIYFICVDLSDYKCIIHQLNGISLSNKDLWLDLYEDTIANVFLPFLIAFFSMSGTTLADNNITFGTPIDMTEDENKMLQVDDSTNCGLIVYRLIAQRIVDLTNCDHFANSKFSTLKSNTVNLLTILLDKKICPNRWVIPYELYELRDGILSCLKHLASVKPTRNHFNSRDLSKSAKHHFIMHTALPVFLDVFEAQLVQYKTSVFKGLHKDLRELIDYLFTKNKLNPFIIQHYNMTMTRLSIVEKSKVSPTIVLMLDLLEDQMLSYITKGDIMYAMNYQDKSKSSSLKTGLLYVSIINACAKYFKKKKMRQKVSPQHSRRSFSTGEMGRDNLYKAEAFLRWLKHGGLYLERLLCHIRGYNSNSSIACDTFLLQIVLLMLQDNRDSIRQSIVKNRTFKLNTAFEDELKRLQNIQSVFVDLGAPAIIVSMVSQNHIFTSRNPQFGQEDDGKKGAAAYYDVLLPLTMRMGNCLLAGGHKQVQHSILNVFIKSCSITTENAREKFFFIALRNLLRESKTKLSSMLRFSSKRLICNQEWKNTIVFLTTTLRFLQQLCEGHNNEIQVFLHRQSILKNTPDIDLVGETSRLVVFLNEEISKKYFHYIENKEFDAIFAPRMDDSMRALRIVAWHKYEESDFELLKSLLMLSSCGFSTVTEMVQGPCQINQLAFVRSKLCSPLSSLLEYCSAVHLNISSNGVPWRGDDPIHLLSEYLHCVEENDIYEPNKPEISKKIAGWKSYRTSKFSPLRLGNMKNSDPRLAYSNLKNRLCSQVSKLNGYQACIDPLLKEVSRLEKSILKTLLGLLEGGRIDAEVIKDIISNLDEDILLHNLSTYWNDRKSTAKSFLSISKFKHIIDTDFLSDSEDIPFLYYNLVMSLIESGHASKLEFKNWLSLSKIRISEYIGRIEIIGVDNELEVLYFPKPDIIKNNWNVPEVEEYRHSLLQLVSRDNPEEKVKDFFLKMQHLISSIYNQNKITQIKALPIVGRLIYTIARGQWYWSAIFLVLTLALNIFMMLKLEVDSDGNIVHTNLIQNHPMLNHVDSVCKYLHFYFAIIMLASHAISWVSLSLENGARSLRKKREMLNAPSEAKITNNFQDFEVFLLVMLGKIEFAYIFVVASCEEMYNFFKKEMIDLDSQYLRVENKYRRGPINNTTVSSRYEICAEEEKQKYFSCSNDNTEANGGLINESISTGGGVRKLLSGKQNKSFHFFNYFEIGFWWAYFLILSNLYILMMLLFSLLGMVFSELFYALCTIDIIRQSVIMRKVIQSVTNNISQLTVTFLLGILVCYWYGVTTFFYPIFRNRYEFDGHMDCDSLLSCFRVHVDYGFIEAMKWKGAGAVNPFNAEIYSISFVIFVNLILAAIISGIIIDAFSQTRDETKAIMMDTSDFCFICNIERENFEQLGISFTKHILEDHNMWQYIWFQMYLMTKDKTEYTGQEQHVWQNLCQGKILFMPIKKARVIQGKYRTEKKTMNSLHAKVDSLDQILRKVSNSLKAHGQRMDEFQLQMNKITGDTRELINIPQQLTQILKYEGGNTKNIKKMVTDIEEIRRITK